MPSFFAFVERPPEVTTQHCRRERSRRLTPSRTPSPSPEDGADGRDATGSLSAVEQMASVHTLAAGVAHGINNPLAYVMGNLSFALGELERVSAPVDEGGKSSAPLSPMLSEIREALVHAKEGSARIRDLVVDLLAFSSGPIVETVVFDLHPVLESALNLTASEIRGRARLVKQYNEVPRVRGDASALERVLFHLLTNAVESIPENESERNEIRLATWTDAGGSAVIEVRDSGSGMPPEVVARVFEPFYTTKAAFGSRNGLGLSIAYGLVGSMGGEIEVTSAVGRGSAFRVKLPASPTADSVGPLMANQLV